MTAFDSINCFNKPSKLSSQITDYLEQQSLILDYLKKAGAKVQIALSEDFLEYNDEIIHHYLCALSDRLEITTHMFRDLIEAFLEIKNNGLLVT